PGRDRDGGGLDARRHPDRRHRLVADLHQHLTLLAARGAGRAHPPDGAGRPHAPPPPHDGALTSMALGTARTRAAAELLRGALYRQEAVLLAILALALAVLATQSGQFLTLDNLLNQGRLMTEVGLVALPMTFIIITGGIDLSVGSTLGLCAIVLG